MKPGLFHISLYDIALLASTLLGLACGIRMWIKKTAEVIDRILGLILVIMALWLARVFCIAIGLTNYFPRWSWVPSQFLLSIGPLLFFYVRGIARPDQKFARKDLLQFSPLLVELGLHVTTVVQSAHSGVATYDTTAYRQGHPVLQWLAFLSVAYYLYRCRQWVNYPARENVTVSPLSKEKLMLRGYWLRDQMKGKRFYLDEELSLNSLAKKLGISVHELSRIINTGLRKNFNDFVNEFRIQDIARKMKDPASDRITLLGIAYECGFNSKTTFNRAFKQILGQSPAEYKKQLKKGGPNHDLAHPLTSPAIISGHIANPAWSFKKLNRIRMFRNYLKMAWRNTLHNKVYSTLNITGLAAGMAVALLIGLWVVNQYSYDRFLPGYRQLYQVEMNLTSEHNGTTTQTSVALPLADVLRKEISGIKYVAETDYVGKMNHGLLVGDKKLYLGGGAVGPDFFKIFPYPFIKGDPGLALKDIYSIVITESTAKALFGDVDPMGKGIRFDNAQNMTVTGVIRDIPSNATMQF
ncbi:MAG TPA: ABC transporter permease, partial [Mucilaginibacter sp.]|nr:ABC transporter permease [Mucilaginibacter sp.]